MCTNFKAGDKVRWNDPALGDYSKEEREAAANRVFTVLSAEEETVVITDGFTYAETLPSELEIVNTRNTKDFTTVKVGDTILIRQMDDNGGKDLQARNYNGRTGIVEHVDSIGQLHGTWGGLAVIPGVDRFEVIATGA